MPIFQTCSTWDVRKNNAISVDLPFLNPIWIAGKRLASSASLLSLAVARLPQADCPCTLESVWKVS